MNDLVLAKKQKTKLNIKQQRREAEEIIEKIGTSEFDVPTTTMLKTQLYFEIKQIQQEGNTPDMFVFYIDLDNLKMINLCEGEEAGDRYIKELLEKYSKHITIGKNKNSDELVGIARNITLEQAKELQEQLTNISAGNLSGSVGYSNDFSEGLGKALLRAEEAMTKNKKEKKQKQMENVIGEENVTNHIKQLYKRILDKLRIDIKELDEKEKQLLERNIIGDKENFRKGIESFQKQREDKYEAVAKARGNELVVDSLFSRIEEAIQKFDLECGNQIVDSDTREKIILAQILRDNPMIGKNQEYFDKVEARKRIQKNNVFMILALRNRQELSVGISNIKGLNEERGHAECDMEIKKTVMKIEEILKKNHIKVYSIFANGVSDIKIIVKKQKNHEKLLEQIEAVPTELYVAASLHDLTTAPIINRSRNTAPKQVKSVKILKDKPHEYYKTMVLKASEKNKVIIRKKLNECKIGDIRAIEKYKEQLLREFYYSDIFEMYAENMQKSKDEILRECLRELILEEQQDKRKEKVEKDIIKKPKDLDK